MLIIGANCSESIFQNPKSKIFYGFLSPHLTSLALLIDFLKIKQGAILEYLMFALFRDYRRERFLGKDGPSIHIYPIFFDQSHLLIKCATAQMYETHLLLFRKALKSKSAFADPNQKKYSVQIYIDVELFT